jgi:hypothetical protein
MKSNKTQQTDADVAAHLTAESAARREDCVS